LATAATEAEREAHLRAEKPSPDNRQYNQMHHNRGKKKKTCRQTEKQLNYKQKALFFSLSDSKTPLGKKQQQQQHHHRHYSDIHMKLTQNDKNSSSQVGTYSLSLPIPGKDCWGETLRTS
jgi:hypothetical protein